MKTLSLQEKWKSRIGPKDFKRNTKAKRDGNRAIGLTFISMLVSVVFMISHL